MNTEIDKILARYFSGKAIEKELRILEHWLAESDENEKQFHQMTLLYQYAGQKEVIQNFDTEKALTKFKTHISEKQKIRSNFKISNFLKAAAAIAVLLISVFTLFYFFQPSKTIRLMAVETLVEYEIFENTNVTLARGTEIIYNAKNKKNIELKGKATFTIHSKENTLANNSKGIVVQAGETFIKDIGTIFTVDATKPDEWITVEVSEGEVWFYTSTNTGVHLQQNESAVYDAQTKQFKMIVETQHATSQEATSLQEIIFHNTPLVEAIEIIKKRYGVEILINSETLTGLFLNASFDKDESVENVLEIITETIAARLSKKGDAYIISF